MKTISKTEEILRCIYYFNFWVQQTTCCLLILLKQDIERVQRRFTKIFPRYNNLACKDRLKLPITTLLLWAPAQRKLATMLYFANVFFIYFFMAALFSGPG